MATQTGRKFVGQIIRKAVTVWQNYKTFLTQKTDQKILKTFAQQKKNTS
jgi:hypothetical protein